MTAHYELVRLKNGTCSIHSILDDETFHPVIGPRAEADALYVKQLRLRERLQQEGDQLVIWDIGLGAAANPLAFLAAAADLPGRVRIVSFDRTVEPLRFALEHSSELEQVQEFLPHLGALAETNRCRFALPEGLSVDWELHLADFPSLLQIPEAELFPKPHAIFFDAYSPLKNPAMWSLQVFTNLFALLDPRRPCALSTYSRSTMLRTALLLAGFFVGIGHATGEKEETTIAGNSLKLIERPLAAEWLGRARRSRSAEPLTDGEYRQAPLQTSTWERLQTHPQFR